MVAGATALLACGVPAFGQSVDALLDKLVDKGILTTKEANELKAETDKGFTTAYQAKSGMPDWVTAFKFNGDLRLRAEDFTSDNSLWVDRWRYRYRLRFGAVATLWDNFDVGLRFTSADPVGPSGSQGGNPNSNNSTFQWDSSKKFLYLDQAYAKWTAINNKDWVVSGTVGKMENPFQLSDMVWDRDITPEGLALQAAFMPSQEHTLRLNAGAFMLGEINQFANGPSPSHDPYVGGAQLLWEAKWTRKIETSLTLAAFGISGKENLTTAPPGTPTVATVPNVNIGNTRTALGYLTYYYNPIVAGGSATYKLASFPLYTGEFPITVGGEYMDNTAASSQNTGWRAGVQFGKSGKKKTWDLSYRYQSLGADAWFSQFVDDDNSAFWQSVPAGMQGNGVGASGFYGGTNMKGHLVKANYSFTDFLTFSVTYYLNELITPYPANAVSQSSHFFADLMFKF